METVRLLKSVERTQRFDVAPTVDPSLTQFQATSNLTTWPTETGSLIADGGLLLERTEVDELLGVR